MVLPYQGDSDFLQSMFVKWAEETPEGQLAEAEHFVAFDANRT
jgi:hypothetical protein